MAYLGKKTTFNPTRMGFFTGPLSHSFKILDLAEAEADSKNIGKKVDSLGTSRLDEKHGGEFPQPP